MTGVRDTSAATEGPYAWRCCDRNFPHIYGIVTDRRVTVDAWRESGIEFQALYPGGAQAAPEPGEILQILEDEVYCDKFDGSYDYGDAVPRILALFATQPPAAPVDQDRLAELQNEAGMYKSLYENAIAQRSSAGTDQEGWDLVAKSWVVLESYGFAPEACDYLPQAIDNALAAVIGTRDDLLAEVTQLRAVPQTVVDRASIIEECAMVVEPTKPRPCDCERCYCGNHGDMEAVAAWDADASNAKAIRALASEAGK
jgi:hypothetical protein